MDDVSLDAAIWRLLDAFELDPKQWPICYVSFAVHPNGNVSIMATSGPESTVQEMYGQLSSRTAHRLIVGGDRFEHCECTIGHDHGAP